MWHFLRSLVDPQRSIGYDRVYFSNTLTTHNVLPNNVISKTNDSIQVCYLHEVDNKRWIKYFFSVFLPLMNVVTSSKGINHLLCLASAFFKSVWTLHSYPGCTENNFWQFYTWPTLEKTEECVLKGVEHWRESFGWWKQQSFPWVYLYTYINTFNFFFILFTYT